MFSDVARSSGMTVDVRLQKPGYVLDVEHCVPKNSYAAAIAQLGERQTEDLKVPGSIPGLGKQQHCADAKQKLRKKGGEKSSNKLIIIN